MATVEKIYVGIDGERVELTGADLTAFKAQRTKDLAEAAAAQASAEAKVAARESALAKLAALGLSAEEIAAL
jgi:DNA-binding NarL/FixJ family response regulator